MKPVAKTYTRLVCACLGAQLSAVVLLGVYESSAVELTYTKPVSLDWLVDSARQFTLTGLLRAIQVVDVFLILAHLLALAVIYLTHDRDKSALRCVYFAIQALLFRPGFAGLVLLVALPYELLHLDGEWFAERTPILIAMGLWIMCSFWIAWTSFPWRKPKSSWPYGTAKRGHEDGENQKKQAE